MIKFHKNPLIDPMIQVKCSVPNCPNIMHQEAEARRMLNVELFILFKGWLTQLLNGYRIESFSMFDSYEFWLLRWELRVTIITWRYD